MVDAVIRPEVQRADLDELRRFGIAAEDDDSGPGRVLFAVHVHARRDDADGAVGEMEQRGIRHPAKRDAIDTGIVPTGEHHAIVVVQRSHRAIGPRHGQMDTSRDSRLVRILRRGRHPRIGFQLAGGRAEQLHIEPLDQGRAIGSRQRALKTDVTGVRRCVGQDAVAQVATIGAPCGDMPHRHRQACSRCQDRGDDPTIRDGRKIGPGAAPMRDQSIALGRGDGKHRAVSRGLGQVELAWIGPRDLAVERLGRERNIADTAIIIDPEEISKPAGIAGIGAKRGWSFHFGRTGAATDAAVDDLPSTRRTICPKRGRGLRQYVAGRATCRIADLGETVIAIAVPQDRGVDHPFRPYGTGDIGSSKPWLGRGEVAEVACDRTQYLRTVAILDLMCRILVKGGGPVDDIGADGRVIGRLRGPGHARVGQIDEDVPLLAPVDQVGRFPDFEIAAPLAGRITPPGAPGRKIGRKQEEAVPFGRPHDERIAQAARTLVRLKDRLSIVQGLPLQGIIAVRNGETQLFTVDAIAGEVDEHIGRWRGDSGGCGLDGDVDRDGHRPVIG